MNKTVIGIDALDYKKRDRDGSEKFLTPLGAGVIIDKPDKFIEAYVSQNEELSRSFDIPDSEKALFYKAYDVKRILGINKAIPFVDNLITEIGPYINSVFISYYIVKNFDESKKKHLRRLGSVFSYITSWSLINSLKVENTEIRVDNFEIWDMGIMKYLKKSMLGSNEYKIYFHGDICDPFISLADIFLFLLEAKLHSQRKKLTPENVNDVFDNYDFDVNVRFFSDGSEWVRKNLKINDTRVPQMEVSKIKKKYMARPIIYIIVDDYNRALREVIEIKYGRYLRNIAYNMGGSYVFYDPSTQEHIHLIEEGDIFFYAGSKSKNYVNTIKDIFDNIQSYPLKEIKNII